ncbi:TPA: formate dehydrogenase accessory sulfurtransferase FdhD, partial [Candidatus Poribacteria bacterium]|nr:formate dehydrogenase accessory sulfurtransferase FdhD [Candidatus Poribacteria bacterium]
MSSLKEGRLERITKLGKTLEIAREDQITLIINDEAYHIMCTPKNVRELVLGFLISEGFASSLKEIEFSNSTCLKGKIIVVDVNRSLLPLTLRSSGCIGVLRKGEKLPGVVAEEKFSLDEIRNSLNYLEVEEYRKTRGYHIAALTGKDGLIFRAYDVGRHNAADKVIGMGIKNNINFSKTFLVISGRISRG